MQKLSESKNCKEEEVIGSDLRATAALAIAGLSANGKTIVKGLEHLERGYEDFSEKFQEIGAKILKKNKNYVLNK